MSSDVDICNRALAAVGTRSTISSLAEGSNESNNCALIYAPTRDQLLRAARWNFASKTATLSLLKSAPGTPENPAPSPPPTAWSPAFPAPPWLFEYAYPNDCMAVRRVTGQPAGLNAFAIPIYSAPSMPSPWWNAPARFVVSGDQDSAGNSLNVILTDMDQALCFYTYRVVEPDAWDSLFTEALVNALAGRLVLALTGDKALAKLRYDMANGAIIQARVADGNEGITVQDHIPDWIRTRGYGGPWSYGCGDGLGYFCEPYGGMFG